LYPGFAYPVIRPLNRGGTWTIDRSRAFAKFGREAPFAPSLVEPASERIVAVSRLGLVVAGKGDEAFRKVAGAESIAYPNQLLNVPRLGGTLISSSSGVFILRGETVERLRGTENIHSAFRMADLPRYRAVVIAAGNSGGVFMRRDDGSVVKIVEMAQLSHDYSTAIHELEFGRILILSAHLTLVVELMEANGGFVAKSVQVLERSSAKRGADGSQGVYFQSLHTYASFGRPLRWLFMAQRQGLERLGTQGFEAIPGGNIPPELGDDGLGYSELPARRVVVVTGGDGMYLFDGKRVTPLPGSSPDRIGLYPRIYDFKSIGKVLVVTTRAVFELTDSGKLVPLSVPFRPEAFPRVVMGEMPASKRAVFATTDGLFSIDAEGQIRRVSGNQQPVLPANDTFKGVIPLREEMLVAGRTALHLIVDRRISGDPACTPAQRNAGSP
jgi:hypothetical protein